MRICELTDRYKGETVFIVGTGPSLRCLDLQFLKGETVLGLNQAWRHVDTTLSVTVHPELVLEYAATRAGEPASAWPVDWVIKKKHPMLSLRFDDPDHYVFETSYSADTVVTRPPDTLYLGEGVQTTAMDLAARMGARFIILVGCDAGSLAGDFHAHDQHVRWLGMKPDDQYRLYRNTTAAVRRRLRHLGVSVMTLSPFIGINSAAEDYDRLRGELSLPPLPTPKDTSGYKRDPKTIRTGD